MSKNRELSQFGSFVYITDETKSIGIATEATPYVGIGTGNAISKLHVVGNVTISGVTTSNKFIIPGGASSGFLKANGDIDTNDYLTSSTSVTLDIVTTNGNTTTNSITVGDISAGIITATDFNSTSDITKKINITPITDSLNLISNLEGVRFNWIDTGNPSVGVIAQQIEQYLPELVSSGEHKTVNYNGLIGVLIEAVKELKIEVEELKKKINS